MNFGGLKQVNPMTTTLKIIHEVAQDSKPDYLDGISDDDHFEDYP